MEKTSERINDTIISNVGYVDVSKPEKKNNKDLVEFQCDGEPGSVQQHGSCEYLEPSVTQRLQGD